MINVVVVPVAVFVLVVGLDVVSMVVVIIDVVIVLKYGNSIHCQQAI